MTKKVFVDFDGNSHNFDDVTALYKDQTYIYAVTKDGQCLVNDFFHGNQTNMEIAYKKTEDEYNSLLEHLPQLSYINCNLAVDFNHIKDVVITVSSYLFYLITDNHFALFVDCAPCNDNDFAKLHLQRLMKQINLKIPTNFFWTE